eukprot:TRINITY_DN14701_c0_g1_i1.p1 TRINITY_DN14701_c0_g1~~TRINITY_DN14701_c0_g1_i1.p1  ORF type:complete len:325 (-),score=57.68 TRINITY_DN14701_c0_g1_i1:65-1039(-)
MKAAPAANAEGKQTDDPQTPSVTPEVTVQPPKGRKEKYLIYGGIAGAVSRTVVAPIDRVKILLQVAQVMQNQNTNFKYDGVYSSLVKMYKEEGVASYWKGNGTNLLRISPVIAMRYYFNEKYKQIFKSTKLFDLNPTQQKIFAGGFAGLTALIGVYPLDLVRTRLAAQTTHSKYTSMRHAFKEIYRKEGFTSFYKGLNISMIGAAPYVATEFTIYEVLKEYTILQYGPQYVTGILPFCFGAVASVAALTVSYPTDLLRKRLMVQGMGSEDQRIYNGVVDACIKIYKGEGVIGFYKGLSTCYIKVVPSQAITWWVVEKCRRGWGD